MNHAPYGSITIENPSGMVLQSVIGLYLLGQREAVIEAAIQEGRLRFPLTITLPCNEHRVYAAVDDLPATDEPCTCGDPTHWFIKYRDEDVAQL